MLTALHIQDIVLIERLSFTLGEGLTALTGETGAGKSILLDALGLACGGRASRTAVRNTAKQGIVTVVFEPKGDHPVWSLLKKNGLDNGLGEGGNHDCDDQIILRRVQSRDGRGRGYINDQPVSIAMLRTIGETLLEIHGQHDGRGFLTAATHRDLLDEFGGHEKQCAELRSLWKTWRATQGELDEKNRERERALREADYLRHVVDELKELNPQEGEETELAGERARLMAAEKTLDDVRGARDAIDDDILEDRVLRALRNLEAASKRTQGASEDGTDFSSVVSKLEITLSELMESRALVVDLAEAIDPDPQTLSRVEERLFALRAAARKHGVTAETLPSFFLRASQSLNLLDKDEAAFGDLEKIVEEARASYFALASKLSANRHKIASILDKAVMSELAPLKLGRAIFSTEIISNEDHAGADGIDQVEFMVATNPGAPKGALKTIASGGELSRFVLAMKAALATKEHRTVIIFDEVDAGVGGAVADAVGERLARLARDAQVLVVTHSPQVAARAQTHWQVSKQQTKSDTLTQVVALNDNDRNEEIARMLSGAKVTEEARAAARQLLDQSSDNPSNKSKRLTGASTKSVQPKTQRKKAS